MYQNKVIKSVIPKYYSPCENSLHVYIQSWMFVLKREPWSKRQDFYTTCKGETKLPGQLQGSKDLHLCALIANLDFCPVVHTLVPRYNIPQCSLKVKNK